MWLLLFLVWVRRKTEGLQQDFPVRALLKEINMSSCLMPIDSAGREMLSIRDVFFLLEQMQQTANVKPF